ncbi:Acyl-CoA dehydrogenase domain protein [Desulfatibacillum aliphaticivorans]|uniref:Acyl-CoA dehydrogenase domain protein n=1 Tax=Desulfatibacillum aliphaticivorans TaxID=218208 RepID=B8FG87_DESAL|nr:acyl-CoA dehydrogenase family protein [Desulfatibacillum aliphaticivorans]ACL03767.1 Acyl-CoA dehydrogenase domain protein [Desulfatibacillum aliphaticivorans]
MAKDLYFNKEAQMVRSAVRDFVKKEINPYVDEWEEAGTTPLHELFKKMGDLGFLGIRYDPKYGGQGMDYWAECAFLEELGRIDCGGVGMAITVQTGMATPAIYEFGSEYLKEKYLMPAIAGDMVSSIAVTEPDAGSDVAALKTYAKKEGDYYIINGSKTYITNGTQADFLTLLARTSDDPGYHCYSLFVVPTDLPGFQISKKLDKLGMRSSDTAELYFDNVKVPVENLIGKEGEGFIQQMQQFQHERFTALPTAYVGVERAIKRTAEYLKGRIVFGKPLLSKQVLRHRLAQWMAEAESLRALTYHIVRLKEAGQDVTREISMGKLLAGQLMNKVADGCLQMHGGIGFMNEMWISRYMRDAKLISIGGGANEVMSEIIFKTSGL